MEGVRGDKSSDVITNLVILITIRNVIASKSPDADKAASIIFSFIPFYPCINVYSQ